MESSAKDMGYHERIEAYPDVNNFQYLDKSPQASIRAFPNREEKFENAARISFGEKRLEVGNWVASAENTPYRESTMQPRRTVFGVLASWIWELLSCVVALGALAGILGVLKKFDGRALKDWPYPVTINTLISILVTITKAAAVIPLAEGISQLKWSWYRKNSRALRDLVAFDEASRGAFGASKLATSKSPFHLASIASILFLISFAIGPFAQQVIQIGQRDITTDGTSSLASVPTCSGHYKDDYDEYGAASGLVNLALSTLGAVYDGILQNGSSTPIDVSCPNGNCTFGTYQSLGFCSRCADITDQLTTYDLRTGKVVSRKDCPSNSSCLYAPGGSDLQSALNVISSRKYTTRLNTTTYRQLSHPDFANISTFTLVNFTAIYGEKEKANPNETTAFECALYFCVQQYNGNVVGGTLSEITTEAKSKIEPSQPWSMVNVTITPEKCFKNGTTKSPPYRDEDSCTYTMYGMNGRALFQAINPPLNGSATTTTTDRDVWSSDIMRRIADTENKIDTIDSVFKSLAKRLTAHIRNSPNICKVAVTGTVSSAEPFISVHWLWIILPVVVVGGTLLLLLAVIVSTRDEYIWKSSPLALVFLGMQDGRQSDGVTHPIFPQSPDIKSMEDSSRDIQVRLDDSGRWMVVGNR